MILKFALEEILPNVDSEKVVTNIRVCPWFWVGDGTQPCGGDDHADCDICAVKALYQPCIESACIKKIVEDYEEMILEED